MTRDHELRDHNFIHATMAWKEVILAITFIAWQTRILELVVDR